MITFPVLFQISIFISAPLPLPLPLPQFQLIYLLVWTRKQSAATRSKNPSGGFLIREGAGSALDKSVAGGVERARARDAFDEWFTRVVRMDIIDLFEFLTYRQIVFQLPDDRILNLSRQRR